VAEHFPAATRMMPPRMLVGFQITKQHRRFVEFADAVRRHRYIRCLLRRTRPGQDPVRPHLRLR
jgi:hypothetical protein